MGLSACQTVTEPLFLSSESDTHAWAGLHGLPAVADQSKHSPLLPVTRNGLEDTQIVDDDAQRSYPMIPATPRTLINSGLRSNNKIYQGAKRDALEEDALEEIMLWMDAKTKPSRI